MARKGVTMNHDPSHLEGVTMNHDPPQLETTEEKPKRARGQPKNPRAPRRPYRGLTAKILTERRNHAHNKTKQLQEQIEKWSGRLDLFIFEGVARENEGVVQYKPVMWKVGEPEPTVELAKE
jgi:hypothetical protein